MHAKCFGAPKSGALYLPKISELKRGKTDGKRNLGRNKIARESKVRMQRNIPKKEACCVQHGVQEYRSQTSFNKGIYISSSSFVKLAYHQIVTLNKSLIYCPCKISHPSSSSSILTWMHSIRNRLNRQTADAVYNNQSKSSSSSFAKRSAPAFLLITRAASAAMVVAAVLGIDKTRRSKNDIPEISVQSESSLPSASSVPTLLTINR